MFVSSFFVLLDATTVGIPGFTVLAGAALAATQLAILTTWVAFIILAMMGRGGPVPQPYKFNAYRPIMQPSGQRADRRTGPD